MALSNTAQRILVSVIAIPLIVAVCYIGKIPFLIFTQFIGLAAFHEFYSMVKNKDDHVNLIVGLPAVFTIILNVYHKFVELEFLILIIVLLLLLTELYRNKVSAIRNIGVSLLGIFYIGFFTAAVLGIREFFSYSDLIYTEGGYLIISILATIWICDSAAFFLGTAFGKHKLFPRVSPNKSWEGAASGFVFAILTMMAAKALVLDFLSWTDVTVIGIIIGILGQYGDLIESLIKRDAGVKDSSAIIPGHGGIFDRFDSLLFSSPFVFIYLNYFL